jgi:hypothetical protein
MVHSDRLMVAVSLHRFADGAVTHGSSRVGVSARVLKATMLAFARQYRPYRDSFHVPLKEIAVEAACSYPTARRAADVLIEQGYLICLDAGGRGRDDPGRYRIVGERLATAEVADVIPIKPRVAREEAARGARESRAWRATDLHKTDDRKGEPAPRWSQGSGLMPTVDELFSDPPEP